MATPDNTAPFRLQLRVSFWRGEDWSGQRDDEVMIGFKNPIMEDFRFQKFHLDRYPSFQSMLIHLGVVLDSRTEIRLEGDFSRLLQTRNAQQVKEILYEMTSLFWGPDKKQKCQSRFVLWDGDDDLYPSFLEPRHVWSLLQTCFLKRFQNDDDDDNNNNLPFLSLFLSRGYKIDVGEAKTEHDLLNGRGFVPFTISTGVPQFELFRDDEFRNRLLQFWRTLMPDLLQLPKIMKVSLLYDMTGEVTTESKEIDKDNLTRICAIPSLKVLNVEAEGSERIQHLAEILSQKRGLHQLTELGVLVNAWCSLDCFLEMFRAMESNDTIKKFDWESCCSDDELDYGARDQLWNQFLQMMRRNTTLQMVRVYPYGAWGRMDPTGDKLGQLVHVLQEFNHTVTTLSVCEWKNVPDVQYRLDLNYYGLGSVARAQPDAGNSVNELKKALLAASHEGKLQANEKAPHPHPFVPCFFQLMEQNPRLLYGMFDY